MDFDGARAYCLSLPNTLEDTPFGPNILVFKTNTKMFALLSFDGEVLSMNLKNTPEKNIELREIYEFIIPGYHMNKKHWNTVIINPYINQPLLKTLILESYQAVLPKSKS